MITTQIDILERLKTVVGDNTDEKVLSLFEDISDTMLDLTDKAHLAEDVVPKAELERANEEWAKKYRDRFFDPSPDYEKEKEKGKEKQTDREKYDFNNLFEKG